MSNKVKRKTPLKKTKLAKTFDYEEKLGIPNPYDKGKFGVKGNKKLLNVKTRKTLILESQMSFICISKVNII